MTEKQTVELKHKIGEAVSKLVESMLAEADLSGVENYEPERDGRMAGQNCRAVVYRVLGNYLGCENGF